MRWKRADDEKSQMREIISWKGVSLEVPMGGERGSSIVPCSMEERNVEFDAFELLSFLFFSFFFYFWDSFSLGIFTLDRKKRRDIGPIS